MGDRTFFVYIMASRSGVLYTGITNSIARRTAQHKARQADSFTSLHRCTRLVWYELWPTPVLAIEREKQVKRWRRPKKIALIRERNPCWADLSQKWGTVIQPYSAANQ